MEYQTVIKSYILSSTIRKTTNFDDGIFNMDYSVSGLLIEIRMFAGQKHTMLIARAIRYTLVT